MVFYSYDGTAKRWFPKAASAAGGAVEQALAHGGVCLNNQYEAEFDVNTSDRPRLVIRHSDKEQLFVVVFAAQQWATLRDAIPEATRQLAGVLSMHLKDNCVNTAFRSAGIEVGPARLARERFEDDPRDHTMVFLEADLDTKQFFTLCEEIEAALSDSKAGEVTGTGWGAGGWSLDLASDNLPRCLEALDELLSARSMTYTQLD